MERRLAAILVADVVNYSRLMGEDERRTLAALAELRQTLFEPLVVARDGKVIKRMGDGWIVEFPNISDATASAVEIQEGLSGHNIIELRIGVHIGDVTFHDDDIYGDGINVAARLEAMAEPGQVLISDTAHQSLDGKSAEKFGGGQQFELKNIARPVAVWCWPANARFEESANEIENVAPALPDKPSIAVLPFDNMSNDPEQEYFADGLTEDIITDLSRFSFLFVISRNTSFTYKGTKIDAQKIAKELGVHFLLEGSIRRSGNRVRVTAQLIDGRDGGHVWAERYDGNLEDVFDLQEEITQQVVGSVAPHIQQAELAHVIQGERVFDEAHDLAWRAYAKFASAMTEGVAEYMVEAIALATRSLELNRLTPQAYLTLCWGCSMQALYGWEDPKTAAEQALKWANRAMEAMPASDTAFQCLGLARIRTGQNDQAISDLARAHELNSNDASTLHLLAFAEATEGKMPDAKRHARQAIRLSPKDLMVGVSYLSLAMAAFVEGNTDEFLLAAQSAIQAQPKTPIRRALMIAYAARIGDKGIQELHERELNEFAPNFIEGLFSGEIQPFSNVEHMELLLNGLRKAGYSY